jgi:predicted N-acetyltransferase YhbS
VLTRPLDATDWPQVAALEAAAYGHLGLSESLDGLRSRAGAGTSFVLDADGTVVGYVLSLSYPYGRCPDLATPEPAQSPAANLHLHDMVVAAERRGTGLGGRLAGHLLTVAQAHGYERVSLVALGGLHAFWARHGFHPQPSVPPPTGYGPGATYMSYPLPR